MRNSTVLTSLCAVVMLALFAGCEKGPPDDVTPSAEGDARIATPSTPTTSETDPSARVEGTGQLGDAADATPGTTRSNPILVATAGGPGPYLTNSAGSALYFVEGDTDGSQCSDECTEVWPPFLVGEVAPSPGPQVQPGLLGTIPRADGGLQVTYNQHPLYRYAADRGAGRTAGHNVKDQWGHWHLIGPSGEALEESEQ